MNTKETFSFKLLERKTMKQTEFNFKDKFSGFKPYRHQIDCINRFGDKKFFALFAEMGTGKTYIMIKNIEKLYHNGEIDTVLVLAPNGVHANWVHQEIPKHLNQIKEFRSFCWRASGGKYYKKELDSFLCYDKLRILCVNHETLQHKNGVEFIKNYLCSSIKTMIIVDESDAYKNPSALRTKNLMKLKKYSKYRRIMTGTPVANSPLDLYSQMEFLDEDILESGNFYSFKAYYCVLAGASNPLVKKIKSKTGCRGTPQIILKKNGIPQYRNIDKLSRLIQPYSFYALKKDCLDLPSKIYKTAYYEMNEAQEYMYMMAKNELRTLDSTGETKTMNQLSSLNKMMQLESNFYILPDSNLPNRIEGDNGKLLAAKEIAERATKEGSKVIIWCCYRFEANELLENLSKEFKCVKHDGGCTPKERERAIDEFQNGDANVFIGTIKSGGVGITLTSANVVIYYNNGFSLRDRLQSEDRAHRIGQKNNVVYYDIICKGKISEVVKKVLASKKDVSDMMMTSEIVKGILDEQ